MAHEENFQPSPWIHAVSGTVGGSSGMLVIAPLDFVKTRLQTSSPGSNKSMFKTARRAFAAEGGAAFFRGSLFPVMGYGAINATCFTAFSASMTELKRFGLEGTPLMAAAGFVAGSARFDPILT